MIHEAAATSREGPRTVVVCSCGHRTVHRDPHGAEVRHNAHAGLNNARTALEGTTD